MKIAGVQKTTLIDYPGQIASVIFTQGCNLACPYCHNPELIPKAKAEEDYLSFAQLRDFLHDRQELIDGICITGGEPTLQPELDKICREIKHLDLKVKLDTNGAHPQIIKELIADNLVDYIALDVKAPLNKYDQFNGAQIADEVETSIELIKQADINYEFRTTVVPGLHTAEDIEEIAQELNGADTYYIQNFKPTNTLDPELKTRSEFPPAKLNKFKELASNYISEVKIRN
jgi:pyruvate formate lyase activating enzyme